MCIFAMSYSEGLTMRPELLSPDQLQSKLSAHPRWRLDDAPIPPQRIIRDVVEPNFLAAIGTINAIALVAEKFDHHPDILLYGWNKLRITITTHDRGGLTELDFQLADAIDQILGN